MRTPWITALLLGGLLLVSACNQAYQAAPGQAASAPALSEAEKQARELEMKKALSFAHEYYKQGNYGEAKTYYLKAFALDDGNTLAPHLKRLATCYSSLGMADSAKVVLMKAVELQPDSWYEHRTLGSLHMAAGDKEAAFASFRTAASLKADDWESHRDMMRMLKDKADAGEAEWDEVIAELDILIGLRPEDAEYAKLKDQILAAHYDPEELIASLRQNHAQFPDDEKTTVKLATSLVEFATPESYREALGLLDGLLAAQPDQTRLLDLKATALEGLGRGEDAAGVLMKLVELKPTQTDLPVRIGELYLAQNNLRQARRWALRSKNSFPGFGKGGLLLGRVYEAAVDACAGKELAFDDKLVYEMAAREYDAISDPAAKGQARQRRTALEEVLPTAEDRFFNKYDRPRKDCYKWLLE